LSQELGVSVATLERWRAEALSRPARERAWTAAARLQAVIAAAAMDEAQRNANRSVHDGGKCVLEKGHVPGTRYSLQAINAGGRWEQVLRHSYASSFWFLGAFRAAVQA